MSKARRTHRADQNSQDPRMQALVHGLSRRRFLQASGIGAAAMAATACGAGGTSSSDESASVEPGDDNGAVDWSNWIAYIDTDDETSTRPSLDAFSADSGVKVTYTEDVNDNDEFFAKVRTQLEQGEDIKRDIVTLTDWMCARWIREGYTQKFDTLSPKDQLISRLQDVSFDQNREYTVPWQSGFGGLGWNTDLLERETGKTELNTLDELWAPELKGRIAVLSEMRDTIGVIMLSQGNDPSNFDSEDFDEALAELQKQIDSGQIRSVAGNDYLNALETGDVIAVIGWSGDVVALGEGYGFAFPESGGTLWTDNSMIPAGAGNKEDAEKLLEYYLDPANAAAVAAYVQYLCPVEGAQDAMAGIDESLVDSEWIFPTDEQLSRGTVFQALDPEEEAEYTEAFQSAIGN